MFKSFMVTVGVLLFVAVIAIGLAETYFNDPLRTCVVTERWSDADVYSCKDGKMRWQTVPTR